MALVNPLRASTGNIQFRFGSPAPMSLSDQEGFGTSSRIVSSPPPSSSASSFLRPDSVNRVPSNSTGILSPSDIVGPSPVTSNGTEITEIEDDATEEIEQDHKAIGDELLRRSELLMLTTALPENVRQGSEEAISVIHAPESFASWKASDQSSQQQIQQRLSPQADESGIGTPPAVYEQRNRPQLSTDVKPVRYSIDSATPRAQDLQDMLSDGSRIRSNSTSSLEKIDEQTEAEDNDDDNYEDDYGPYMTPSRRQDDEITALRKALSESWTLCNSLAKLSSNHRARMFHSSGKADAHEKAWKTCWKLCQRLYDYRGDNDTQSLNVRMSLDLCRDFCQALFNIRQKKDETADSVVRVIFELNNHLYSAQDSRNLPEVFRERTLDFYITICHRLMRQRADVANENETDQLLHACWSVAEMLFNLRQNSRDGQPPDEELLSSAVKACWDLMDIFRHGWTQVQPERNTPRPNQTIFFPYQPAADQGSSRAESRTSMRSSHSKRESSKPTAKEERPRKSLPVPETPVTEFEDTPISPESTSPQMPNIMVLGTPSEQSGRASGAGGGRWSSNASNLSSYSHSSARTSSTATTTAASEDPTLARVRILVLRAAMNLGFGRETGSESSSSKAGLTALQKFVQGLPQGSFAPITGHSTLLQQYKGSVMIDGGLMPRNHVLPARGKRASAVEVAKSVHHMCQSSPRYAYLRDLFRFVFQFSIDEVDSRRNVVIFV